MAKKRQVCCAEEDAPYTLTDLSELLLKHQVPEYGRMYNFCIRAIATYGDCIRQLQELRTEENAKSIDDLLEKQNILFHGSPNDPGEEELS